jgi:DNA-binding response OmpR family regulator
LRVDAQTFEVWRGDAPLPRPLSPQEFTLVAYLYRNQERVCTRRELGDAIWGAHAWDPSMLHNLVRRTKAKLEVTPAGPPLLRSVRGIGYRLTP